MNNDWVKEGCDETAEDKVARGVHPLRHTTGHDCCRGRGKSPLEHPSRVCDRVGQDLEVVKIGEGKGCERQNKEASGENGRAVTGLIRPCAAHFAMVALPPTRLHLPPRNCH